MKPTTVAFGSGNEQPAAPLRAERADGLLLLFKSRFLTAKRTRCISSARFL